MQTQSEVGRRPVLAVIVALLIVSLMTITFFNMVQGPQRLPEQIVRFILTVVLCVFLYRGANWARWVAGVLFALGGIGALVAGVAALTAGSMGLALIFMGLIYLASVLILFFIPSVQAHFVARSPEAHSVTDSGG